MQRLRKRIIKDWIKATVDSESWKQHSDIHITEIDPTLINPEKWAKESLDFFAIAQDILRKNYVGYKLLLHIPLEMAENKGLLAGSIYEITTQIRHTPPSLYILPWNVEDFMDMNGLNNMNGFSPIVPESTWYFFNSYDEEEKRYYRSIYLIG